MPCGGPADLLLLLMPYMELHNAKSANRPYPSLIPAEVTQRCLSYVRYGVVIDDRDGACSIAIVDRQIGEPSIELAAQCHMYREREDMGPRNSEG